MDSIAKIIFENLNVEKVNKTSITINSNTYHKTKLHQIKPLILEYLTDEEKLELVSLSDDDFREEVMLGLPRIKEELETANMGLSEEVLLYVPHTATTADDYIVYDKEHNEFPDITYRALTNMYSMAKVAKVEKKLANMVFDPLIISNSDVIDEEIDGRFNLSMINSYRHPACRERFNREFRICKSQDNIQQILSRPKRYSLPPQADALLSHLFPKTKAKHYFLHWLYYAMVRRNGNPEILVLEGPQGIGKNVLIEGMVKHLIGASRNFISAPKNIFQSNFNIVLRDRRMIFVDEAEVSYKSYEKVKSYTNNYITIEAKRVNADKEFEMFHSFIVAINTSAKWYIHFDDRRSSILDMTSKKLDEIWSDREIDDFIGMCREDEEFMFEICRYVLTRSWEEEYDPQKLKPLKQYRSEKFYQFVFDHLSSWQQFLLEKVLKTAKEGDNEVDIDRVLEDFQDVKRSREMLPKRTTVKSFVASYKHMGKYYLGEIEENTDIRDLECILKINPRLVENGEEDLL